MAFAAGIQDGITRAGAGERYGANLTILGIDNFESGLKIGRFAKVDTGRVDNMDGSSTPVIAGLVLRKIGTALEDGETLTTTYNSEIDLLRTGLGTVGVKAGETPAFNGVVYASNAGDANDGLAVTTSTNAVATNARFVMEIKSGVWLIEMAGQAPQSVTNIATYRPQAYTVSTVPTASANSGVVIYVSNGAAGEEVLAVSNGTNWIKLDGTGEAIAAS